jgi:homogentisate 1,2-dioxygenase
LLRVWSQSRRWFSRQSLLVNKDCTIGLAAPQKSLRDYFYKKCGCWWNDFHSQREGKLLLWWEISRLSMEITLLSRGVIYQIDFDTAVNRLYVESFAYFQNDKKNPGKHLQHAHFLCLIFFFFFFFETNRADFIWKFLKGKWCMRWFMPLTLWCSGLGCIIFHTDLAFIILNQ